MKRMLEPSIKLIGEVHRKFQQLFFMAESEETCKLLFFLCMTLFFREITKILTSTSCKEADFALQPP